MPMQNNKSYYVVERFSFNVWWDIAEVQYAGDAHLIAKALRDASDRPHRVMMHSNTGAKSSYTCLAQYDTLAPVNELK